MGPIAIASGVMILPPPTPPFETDKAGQIIYPVDNGEPLSNDTEHLKWITFVKYGLDDWFGDRTDVFVAADLLWYPIEGRPDISQAPDVMVVLDHPPGERPSYKQWEENDRPPNIVFEFISKSNTADEMMDKLEFYSEMGCDEFYVYDYRRGKLSAFHRDDGRTLAQKLAGIQGEWQSPLLGITLGLDASGKLCIRRPDGRLMETQRQIARRTEAEAQRAARLAAKLRELGVDPDSI